MTSRPITILGAGITGLWQAVILASRGYTVKVYEGAVVENTPTRPASWYAGGMLAPDCEGETAGPVVSQLGRRSIELWRQFYPDVTMRGSLVVASGRDRADLLRFARLTSGHTGLNAEEIQELEPDLAHRFRQGLFFTEEAHIAPRPAMAFLRTLALRDGVTFRAAEFVHQDSKNGHTIDCRGYHARDDLTALRGVRGEMAVVKTCDVHMSRPVRLLHPRFPLYVVPWGDDRYMIGATVIERDDDGPVTVRSGLELLGHAYALHPGFGEAEIIEMGAGVRPAFADNTPKIVVREERLYINGMYRHGFLTAPALAELVADYLDTGATHPEVFIEYCCERHGPEHTGADAAGSLRDSGL